MATVFVWNNKIAGWGSGGGHVAISIDDEYATAWNQRITNYVSWFGLINDNARKFPPRMDALQIPNLYRDLAHFKYSPDHILQLDLNAAEELAMARAWQEEQNENNHPNGLHYRPVRKNCAVMAVRILKVLNRPGQSAPLPFPLRITSPNAAKRMALSMGAVKIRWSDFLSDLFHAGAIDAQLRTALLQYRRAHSQHGSSGAPAKFGPGASSKGTSAEGLREALARFTWQAPRPVALKRGSLPQLPRIPIVGPAFDPEDFTDTDE